MSDTPKRTLTEAAREKIREAHRKKRNPSRAHVYASDPDAWWNTRPLITSEVAYAVELAYEAGIAAKDDLAPDPGD